MVEHTPLHLDGLPWEFRKDEMCRAFLFRVYSE